MKLCPSLLIKFSSIFISIGLLNSFSVLISNKIYNIRLIPAVITLPRNHNEIIIDGNPGTEVSKNKYCNKYLKLTNNDKKPIKINKAREIYKNNDLLNIDGIGETQVKSIENFFSNKMNLKIINELENR